MVYSDNGFHPSSPYEAQPPYGVNAPLQQYYAPSDRYAGAHTGYQEMWQHDHEAVRPQGRKPVAPPHEAQPPYGVNAPLQQYYAPSDRYAGVRTGYQEMWQHDHEAVRPQGRKPVAPPHESPLYDEYGRLVAVPHNRRRGKAGKHEGVVLFSDSQLGIDLVPATTNRPVKMQAVPPPYKEALQQPAPIEPKLKVIKKHIPHFPSQLEINGAIAREDADIQPVYRSAQPKKHFQDRIAGNWEPGTFYSPKPPYWTMDCVASAPLGTSAKRSSVKTRYPPPAPF